MNYKEKNLRIFNKLYSSFLKDLKEVSPELRTLVKAGYKVIDKTSDEYCKFFCDNLLKGFDKLKEEVFDDEVNSLHVCKGISVGEVLGAIDADDVETKAVVMNYVYSLLLFAYMYQLDATDEEAEALFNQVVEVLSQFQHNEEMESEILDDDIDAVLQIIKKYPPPVSEDVKHPEASDATPDPTSLFAALGDSKIASIAKEISKDIDTSKLQGDNPDELIKNMFDFSGGNNMLGNIVQKVSTTLNEKISSGELKHEELLGEAMSMMNLFGGSKGGAGGGISEMLNNPMFSQLMKGMKAGRANVRQDVISKSGARDRLRKKLEARNKNKNVE